MAGRPRGSTNKSTENKEEKTPVQKTAKKQDDGQNEILEMLKAMQKEIESIKKENEELKVENVALKDSNHNQKESDDFNKLVSIKNMFDGESLTLKINDEGRKATLPKRSTLRRRLVEVLDVVRLNPKFARLGYFIIEDKDIVEKYFPEMIENYKKTIDFKQIDNIGSLQIEELKTIFSEVNYLYQQAIIDKFVREWIKSEDMNYMNPLKIQALTDISKIDVMALINGISENENSKREFVK